MTRYLLAAVFVLAGCSGDGGDGVQSDTGSGIDASDGTPDVPDVTILELRAPDPILPGTQVHVVVSADLTGGQVFDLELDESGRVFALPFVEFATDGALVFEAPPSVVADIGSGTFAVDVRVRAEAGDTTSRVWTPTFADDLTLAVGSAPSGATFYADRLVINGDGFLGVGEGTTTATLNGTFAADGGATSQVTLTVPLALAEPFARERAVFEVPVALGEMQAGSFDGDMTVETVLMSGQTHTSAPLAVSLDVQAPIVFSGPADPVRLGELVVVEGGGFLSGEYSTTFMFAGEFVPDEGDAVPFDALEIVPEVWDGNTATLFFRAVVGDKRLVAERFGYARGDLIGEVVVTTTDGRRSLSGLPTPVSLTLAGAMQVVHLVFLPGFYDVLDTWGLGAGATDITERIRARIADLYADYAVRIDLQPPADFDPNHFARLEIGGPDPNGLGLFGFDNTAGKDVGNLRLFDAIGGENFETQTDGYPGYGGVFIESMLWWGSAPPIAGARPPTAPTPDPDFDAVFAPVFETPATPTELQGEGPPERVTQVVRARDAFANLVGETAAHELGHSLGLAEPYGSDTQFHNTGDTDGCLMDHGADRPFGERAGLEGFTETRLCGDAPAYLEEILPR